MNLHFLVLFLMEQKKNPGPLFTGYVENLPQDFSYFAVNLSDEDLSILKETYILKRITQVKELLASNYSLLSENLPDLGSFEDYKLAYLQVSSRQMSMTKENFKLCALVPYADMLNTDFSSNIEYSYNQDQKAFIFTAKRAIEIGEELSINYGNHDMLHFFI